MGKIQTIDITQFTGLNTLDDPSSLNPSESPYMLNMDIGKNGTIITRFGYELMGTVPSASGAMRGCLTYYNTYGSYVGDKLLLFHNNGNAYYVDNSSFTPTLIGSYGTDGARVVRGIVFNNLAIFGNGLAANTVKKYDGNAMADLGGTPPDGDIFGVFGKRVFISGVDASPSNVYYSDADDPETWSGNALLVNVGDGWKVTALESQSDALQIFKENTIHGSNFTYDSVYNISTPILLNVINNQGGAIATDSVYSVYGSTYFLSRQGFQSYATSNTAISANTTLPLSLTITPTISEINFNVPDQMTSIFYNNKYMCAVPLGDSTVADHVFVYDESVKRRYGIDNWTIYNHIPAVQFAIFRDSNKRDQLYFVSNAESTLYKFNETFSDAGSGYTRKWKSKTFQFGERTLYHYIDIEGAMTLDSSIYVDIETDGIEVLGTDTNGEVITGTLPADGGNLLRGENGEKIEELYLNKLYTGDTITSKLYKFKKRVQIPAEVREGNSMNFTIYNSADSVGWLVSRIVLVYETLPQDNTINSAY